MGPLLFGVAFVGLFVVVRHVALRRVAAGQGRYLWLAFTPLILGGVVMLWTGLQSMATSPFPGIGLVVLGAGYLGLIVRFLRRASRSVSVAGSRAEVETAMTDAAVDYLEVLTAVVLVGAAISAAALIVWGITQAH